MMIEKHTVVGIDYTLTDDTGSVFETTVGSTPLYYVHGVGAMIAGIERALEGLHPGDNKRILLTPAEAYGHRQQEHVIAIPARSLAETVELRVGMRVQLNLGKTSALFTVMNKGSNEVVLDGNHPLAGLTLLINIEVVSVRKATQDEIAGQASVNTKSINNELFLSQQLAQAV